MKKLFLLLTLVAATSATGCSYIGTASPAATTVSGEAWYVRV